MHMKSRIQSLYSLRHTFLKDEYFKIVKYIITGISNTVLGFIAFIILTELLKFHYIISNTIVAVIYLFGSFLMNNYWVFIKKVRINSTKVSTKNFSRYLIVYIFNHLIDSILLLTFTEVVKMPFFISKGFNMMLITSWNYFIFNNLVFKHDR